MPDLASCSSGSAKGRYHMGAEYFYPCGNGYVLRQDRSSIHYARCYAPYCAPREYEGFTSHCPNKEPRRRVDTRYVEIWVNGSYLGKSFYNIRR